MSKARNLANLLADGAVGASELADTLDLSGKTLSLPEGVGGGVTTDSEANRPASPAVGTLFFNTTQDTLQQFTAQGWQDVGLEPFSISSVTGNIFTTSPGTLTISGANFGVSATVRFTVGVSNYDVSVTPASSTSITVSTPSEVYGQTAGTSISVAVIQNNRVSNQVNKSVLALPTGGTITTSGGYRYHTFLSSGNFVVPSDVTLSTEALIVAGGGGGGTGDTGSAIPGAGGGAGGMLVQSQTVTTGTYSIQIGLGGAARNQAQKATGGSGGNTAAFGYTAIGGGGGASRDTVNGLDATLPGAGGSGGGANIRAGNSIGGAGTSGQGNKGGDSGRDTGLNPCGGGGGKAEAGKNYDQGGHGGAGVEWPSGSLTYYAGGGGRGVNADGSAGTGGNGGGGNGCTPSIDAVSGAQNTGGGGGGASSVDFRGAASGGGGSGIVIVRYQL